VADHIPVLLENIIAVLRESVYKNDVHPPMDDPAVIDAAKKHAQVRFEQGLGPVAIVTEFRLLRHEIGRALISSVGDAPATDILAGQAVIDDALDGAATVGLDALSNRVESLRDEFLATTVHDLRQPITLVTGSLDLAARWLSDPEFDHERVTEAVNTAVIAVNEINVMLDTLGDASRLAMGALEPDPEPAKLDAIVGDALALLDAESRRRVTFESSAAQLVGLWDPHLLRRVVSNLVSNALKYSPPGGLVEVEVSQAADGLAQLEVRDHGMGLSTDEATVVFDRFARAERARAQGIPGLGLGLYACRGIIAAHGGTIVLQSDGAGSGTTVVVALPLIEDDGEG
jgi:signal transduction histidine kinase